MPLNPLLKAFGLIQAGEKLAAAQILSIPFLLTF